MNRRLRLIQAPLVADASGVHAAPGVVLLEGSRLLAAGAPEAVGAAEAAVERLEGEAVLPAMVNAHAHLDLTHVGPQPFEGSFVGWIEMVRSRRATDPQAIAASVDRGVELLIAGGCAAVGDIAGIGSLVPLERLRASPLAGASFIECFGTGVREPRAIAAMEHAVETTPLDEHDVRLGLQPHAPYSCGPGVYAAAAELGRRHGVALATHLAETPEELELLLRGAGPFVDFLRALGAWDENVAPPGCHPLEALREALEAAPWVAAHLNYVERRHVEWLAACRMSVAYCPRASAYFGHPQAAPDGSPRPHAYREMAAAGVVVALGTDSLICLDTPGRLSILDEMRFLRRRDGADPMLLLAMATVNGAKALGLDPRAYTLAPGAPAGLIAAPLPDADSLGGRCTLRHVLSADGAPRWLLGPGAGAAQRLHPVAGSGAIRPASA